MAASEWSILLPTLNEGNTLGPLVQSLLKTKQFENAQILVLDSGSSDCTFDAFNHLAKTHSNLRWIDAPLGKAMALRVGFAKANSKYIAFMDSDLQYLPQDLPKLCNEIEKGADLALSKRVVIASQLQGSQLRRSLSLFYSQIIGKKLLNLACSDPQSGMKAFRASLLEGAKFKSGTWSLDIELIRHAQKKGAKIKEVEIAFEPRRGGRAKADILFTGSELMLSAAKEYFRK